MQHLIENSSKWALSEPNLGPNLTKWTLSGFKSGHVRIIGGGSCPRVDLVRKVGILCGRGVDFQKKLSYCVGVVRVDVTTPTPYGYFFRKYVPLQHHMATFRTTSTLGQDPPPIIPAWPDLNPENANFVKCWPKFGSDNAHFVELSIKFCLDSALF